MNTQQDPEISVTWITLREASLLLGCSVKTIRRRIKAGTWRSMIEYQGQKAIRLVAREDIIKETSVTPNPIPNSINTNLAVHALQNVHHKLDITLGTELEQLNRKLSASVFGSRLYLIVSLIITAIFIIGFMVLFSDSREDYLGQRMVDMKKELSTIISANREVVLRAEQQTTELYNKSISVTTDSNQKIKDTREEIERLSSIINSARENSVTSIKEAENTQKEIGILKKEISSLRAEIYSLRKSALKKTEVQKSQISLHPFGKAEAKIPGPPLLSGSQSAKEEKFDDVSEKPLLENYNPI